MPAQQLAERTKGHIVGGMGIPPNNSSQALVKEGLDDGKVEFKAGSCGGGATSGHVNMRQWITVAVLVYVNLINYMDRLTLAGILTDIQHEFNANDAMMGLLQTAFIVSYMFFAPLFGYLGDRYSRKAIMAAGVFLWSIFTLIGSFMSGSGKMDCSGFTDQAEKAVCELEARPRWDNMEYWAFLACRAMVGIGEASYSTIAPTIISDMFVKDMRSKMLALFYFAIPVGSGLGYIVGSEAAAAGGHWQWGLRATPIAGCVATILILALLIDPPRGESEGHSQLEASSYTEDLSSLAKNKSFVLSTLAFTCVTFCTGALSWWGPKYIEKGMETMAEHDRPFDIKNVALFFGVVTMMSGIVGVPLGMTLSTSLKSKYPRADPIICAIGLLSSAFFLSIGMFLCHINTLAAFLFLFVGEVALNLNWSIVADMLLYVVVPTCRSTAEAIQILASHMFGDAGSPYLIGVVSDALRQYMTTSGYICSMDDLNLSEENTSDSPGTNFTTVFTNNSSSLFLNSTISSSEVHPCAISNTYFSLQYSLFTSCGIEVIGGILFFVTAVFIVRDKESCEASAVEMQQSSNQKPELRLMLTAKYSSSPDSSIGDEMPSDDEEAPKLQLIRDTKSENPENIPV